MNNEDIDLLSAQKTFKANLVITGHAKAPNGERMTYDEAVELLDRAIDSRECLGPFDPAFPFVVRQVSVFSKIAAAIAWTDKSERKDHLKAYQVIWSFAKGTVVEQGEVWISKGTRHEGQIMGELRDAVREQMIFQGIKQVLLNDLEVVFA